MYKKDDDFFMPIPRFLICDEIKYSQNRAGILFAYCWIGRFGSFDGLFEGKMIDICQKMGLHYDESKTKVIPKQLKNFIKGMDYLIDLDLLKLEKGDYHDIFSSFSVSLTQKKFVKFTPFRIKYFDFILEIKKRTNKSNLLYMLLFILSCYSTRYINNKKQNDCVCSYSLAYISQKTGISEISVHNYLSQLSSKINKEESNTPLLRSERWCLKFNEKIVCFPVIYVENTSNATQIIKNQRIFIRDSFVKGELSESIFLNNSDLDDLF